MKQHIMVWFDCQSSPCKFSWRVLFDKKTWMVQDVEPGQPRAIQKLVDLNSAD